MKLTIGLDALILRQFGVLFLEKKIACGEPSLPLFTLPHLSAAVLRRTGEECGGDGDESSL
jgi:hypothetical protein